MKTERQTQQVSQDKVLLSKEARESSAEKDQEQRRKPDCNVRLTFKGQNETIKITDEMKFNDLKIRIKEIFNIEPEAQVIKTGFPPKEFQQPLDGNDPIGLKHGERLFIEEKLSFQEEPRGKGRGTKRVMKKQGGGKNTGKRVGYRLGAGKQDSAPAGQSGGQYLYQSIAKQEKHPCESSDRKDQREEILPEEKLKEQTDIKRKSETEAVVEEHKESPDGWGIVEMNNDSNSKKSDEEALKEATQRMVEDMERNMKSLKDEGESKEGKESIDVDVFFQKFCEVKDGKLGEVTVGENIEVADVATIPVTNTDQSKDSMENVTNIDVIHTDEIPKDNLNPRSQSLTHDKDNLSLDEDTQYPDTLSVDACCPNSIPSNLPPKINDLDAKQQELLCEAGEMAVEFVNKGKSAATEIKKVPMREAEDEREVDQDLVREAENEREAGQIPVCKAERESEVNQPSMLPITHGLQSTVDKE